MHVPEHAPASELGPFKTGCANDNNIDVCGYRSYLGEICRVWDPASSHFCEIWKVRNTAQSTKMADGIYSKLYIFNTPV